MKKKIVSKNLGINTNKDKILKRIGKILQLIILNNIKLEIFVRKLRNTRVIKTKRIEIKFKSIENKTDKNTWIYVE